MSETFSDPGSPYQSSAGELQVSLPVAPTAVAAAAAPPIPEVLAKPLRVGTSFGVWLRDLVVSLAISAFIIIFLYQPVKVEGTSMMPSLEDQERIFVNKFVYRLGPDQRGEIRGVRCPRGAPRRSLRRVYGVQGVVLRVDAGPG